MSDKLLYFASDYQEGAHPNILKRLEETNLVPTTGYGTDEFCATARERIRKACNCPNASVNFLVGGTQTNATVIDAFLHTYEGVLSADSGHVGVHEAGAIEFGGHKVLTVKSELGKLTADSVRSYLETFYGDDNWEHMVQPGMVYISQPTEYGTMYNLAELEAISAVCHEFSIPLYVDGARLAYALAAPGNDVTLPDLARLCDCFYIGGTKCGALFGEAVVIPDPDRIPHFFTIIKQHGALLAKGRMLGIQFDELFKNDLYFELGRTANEYAARIKAALLDAGVKLYFDSPTNQVFFVVEKNCLADLEKKVVYNFGEFLDEDHAVIRFCTSWASTEEDVEALLEVIRSVLKTE